MYLFLIPIFLRRSFDAGPKVKQFGLKSSVMYGMDQENKVSKIFIVSLSSNGRGGKISIKKIKKICGPNCEIRLAKLTNHGA